MLRSTGVYTDIRTGLPTGRQPDQRKGQAQARYTRSLLDASEMAASLHQNNAVLKIFIKQYMDRLEVLSRDDPICQTLEASINEIRNVLEVLPIMREQSALRVLGPQLSGLIEEDET